MSDDTEDKQSEADTAAPHQEPQPSQSTYEQLRELNEFTLNGVTFVRRSNFGPISIHFTGSSDTSKP